MGKNQYKTEKNIPVKPDSDNDPTRLKPGVNEPEKIDPTRIDEPSPSQLEPPKKQTGQFLIINNYG